MSPSVKPVAYTNINIGPQEPMLRIACDAPCDFGCVIFAEYLLIPGLEVAMPRTNLQSPSSLCLPLERRNTIGHMQSSIATDGETVSAYKASVPMPAERDPDGRLKIAARIYIRSWVR